MRGCESKFGHGLFLLTEGVAQVWKFRFMKTWSQKTEKADFKVDALQESIVATQSSAVKSWNLDCTIILHFVAAQGRVVCGLFLEAASLVTYRGQDGGEVAKKSETTNWC